MGYLIWATNGLHTINLSHLNSINFFESELNLILVVYRLEDKL